MRGLIDRIRRLFHRETKEEIGERLFAEGKLESRVEEETDTEFFRKHFEVDRIVDDVFDRHFGRPSERTILRHTGRSVPSRTHGRPIDSYTGRGMDRLRSRSRKSRQHEKRMGVDHNLTMGDVEESPRKRRRGH